MKIKPNWGCAWIVFFGLLVVLIILNFTVLNCYLVAVTPRGAICRSFLLEVARGNQGLFGYIITSIIILVTWVIAVFLSSIAKKEKENKP